MVMHSTVKIMNHVSFRYQLRYYKCDSTVHINLKTFILDAFKGFCCVRQIYMRINEY